MHSLKYAILAGAAFLHNTSAYHHTTNPAPANCSTFPTSPWLQSQVFHAFLEQFYVKKDTTNAILQHMSEHYIQHNPYVLSGRQNSIDYVGPIFKVANFTIVHHGFGENLGWVHTKMVVPEIPFSALVDIYRFEGTCIVEHWDVLTQLPANATNPLALF